MLQCAALPVQFSGVQGNGSSEGHGSGTSHCGHEHVASCEKFGTLQTSLMDLVTLMDDCTCGVQATLGACPSLCLPVFSTDGKLLDRRPRLSSDSHNRYMSRTERLTYTMERHDISLPCVRLSPVWQRTHRQWEWGNNWQLTD